MMIGLYDIRKMCDRRVGAIRCRCPVVGQPQGAAPTFYDHAMGGFRITQIERFCGAAPPRPQGTVAP